MAAARRSPPNWWPVSRFIRLELGNSENQVLRHLLVQREADRAFADFISGEFWAKGLQQRFAHRVKRIMAFPAGEENEDLAADPSGGDLVGDGFHGVWHGAADHGAHEGELFTRLSRLSGEICIYVFKRHYNQLSFITQSCVHLSAGLSNHS
jgi:hypothetical protein